MSTSKEYIEFVCEQLDGIEGVAYRKMFGEYLVYIQEKPILLVCDNCVMVKKVPELAELMKDAPDGFPYDGAKVHYVLDIENRELVRNVIEILLAVTPLPKRKKQTAKPRRGNHDETLIIDADDNNPVRCTGGLSFGQHI